MNILMIISEAPPVKSGVARVANQLSHGLQARGHHVDLLSLKDIPRLQWGEVRISSMPFKLAKIRRSLRDYDVVHLHGPVPTFSDVFLLRGLSGLNGYRPNLVYTYHAPIDLNHPLVRPFAWTYNLIQERWSRLADHVVVSTPSYAQRLSRYVRAAKLSVIPWGVDYPNFQAALEKEDPFTVVYLGQIRPYKGLPVLLKAAHGLKATRVWVIGNGHCSEKSLRQAEKLDINDLTFWGTMSDEKMIALLKQAHIIVLPSVSKSEAFGISLLEGMAAGMVPVASHLPGVADLVGNEGITFPPGDHQALREALKRLRDDPSLRLHLASLAQAKARLYPWERVTFGYERIFENLVMKPAPRTGYRVSEIPTKPLLQAYYD